MNKLLVFCKDISHAEWLCEAVAAAIAASAASAANAASAAITAELPGNVAPFECMTAHSRVRPPERNAQSLARFNAPGIRAALFVVRMYQEGVEAPELNGIFFGAPRQSPLDIIQSVCRPLNILPGKPESIVFLPVLHDPALPPDDTANLKRYATIVPFIDALLSEDPTLYNHLLDPAGAEYPIGVLGTHSLGLRTPQSKRALLAAVRKAVHYKGGTRKTSYLMEVARIPWDIGFGELHRVVTQCQRYPKTTDMLMVKGITANLHTICKYYAKQYKNYKKGRPCSLEPFQLRQLEQLPKWDPFGIRGPYAWRYCISVLEQWLATHNGIPPMVEIHIGGYVGLDASDLERLSGFLTTINQQDGKRCKNHKAGTKGFKVSPKKMTALERVCAPYGLRCRKVRNEHDIPLAQPPTFIQEAAKRFKAYFDAYGSEGDFIVEHFYGYPQKHLKQEHLDVVGKGLAPPSRTKLRSQEKKRTASAKRSGVVRNTITQAAPKK